MNDLHRQVFALKQYTNVQPLPFRSYPAYRATTEYGLDICIHVFADRPDGSNPFELQFMSLILQGLTSPHLVKFVGIFKHQTNLYVVTEHCAGGSLLDRLNHLELGTPNRDSVVRGYFRDICAGVQNLHAHHIAHRRLSLETVLLNANGKALVGNFKYARGVNPPNTRISSVNNPLHQFPNRPPIYHNLPPELVVLAELDTSIDYDPFKMDIYCLGLMLFYAVSGEYPFGRTEPVTPAEVDELRARQNSRDYQFGGGMPEELKNLLGAMLDPLPAARPTIGAILANPWMSRN